MDDVVDDQTYQEKLMGLMSRSAVSRRSLLKRGLALGLATPAVITLLAACGGDDDESDSSDSGSSGSGNATATESTGDAESTKSTDSGDSGSDVNKEFVMVINSSVADADPQSAYDNVASSLFFAAYEMLIRFDGESTTEYVPMLATSWEQNDDATEYTFVIPEGVKFHDGSDCDAQSVKDSFARLLNMGRGPVSVISRFVSDADAQISVENPTTVKFTMNKPEPLFLSAMASEYGPFIMSMKAMEEHKTEADPYAHEWFSQNMVGTGPYFVSENSPQDRVVFDRFEDYHGAAPFFERIIARVVSEDATRRQLIETGDADAVAILPPEDLEALKTNPDVQVVEYASTQCNWIRSNYVTIPDPKARQAFAYAWPYEDVIDGVMKGFAVVQGPIADSVIGFDPDVPVYSTDLEKAKSLFAEAGIAEGDTFTFVYGSGDTTIASMAQLFQANLAELGINLDIQQIDRAALIDLNYGDAPAEERPHFTSTGWWPDYNDSWSQFYPNFHTKSIGSAGANSSYYSNAEADELMDKLEVATTVEEIEDLTSKLLQLMMWDDPAGIFYSQLTKTAVLSKDIRGFVPNGIYINSFNFPDMTREG